MRPSGSALLPSRLRNELISDERLVARVRAGDARAFEAIYDRYEAPIRSFCRHLVGQADDADDAVQHTFLAAYRTIRDGGKEIELRPWLFTVARNRCRSLLRSRRRDPWLRGETFEPSTEGLAAAVERRESLRDLVRDIGGLPEDQRAALILTQLETLRHDEVARVLDVPTDKVKALVFQARSSLISTRQARDISCHEIREQLATLTGPALRRGHLKRHLHDCVGCRDFELALKRQRAAIVVLLPVLAQPALKSRVLRDAAGSGSGAGASAGAGTGTGGTLGGLAAKGAVLKLAAAVVVAAGAGVTAVSTGAFAEVAPGFSHSPSGTGGEQHAGPVGHRQGQAERLRAPMGSGRAIDPPTAGGLVLSSGRSGGPKPGSSREQAGSNGLAPAGTGPSASGAPPGNGPGSAPGLAKKGGVPPGLAKKGGVAPGLAKKDGLPPGLAKKGGVAPGLAKGKPDAAPGQTKKPTPSPDPGGGRRDAGGDQSQEAGGPEQGGGANPGSANDNAGSNGYVGGNGNGNAGGNGNGNAGGNGNGRGTTGP